MDVLSSDKSLSKWLINNYRRYFKSSINDIGTIINDLHNKGFSDDRIVDFAKANNTVYGLEFI